MPCEPFNAGGGVAIVCSRGRRRMKACEVCKARPMAKLCDAAKPGGGTCDLRLCSSCAVRVGTHGKSSPFAGDSVDYCPKHAEEHHARVREGVGC